jgi:type I restriction enzyme S subunit
MHLRVLVMALSKLGDFIELVEGKNTNAQFDLSNIKGISTKKQFITTKADMDGISLAGYKIVNPMCFAYVADTSRRGYKISLAFNDTKEVILVSSITTVFRVKPQVDLLPIYLFMYFNRPEFDRYSRFNSWGSAREAFSWEDMCDIEIDIPPIEVQQKVVDVYLAMVANQKAYEKGLDDLKLTYEAYIENLRRVINPQKIAPYIEKRTEKNINRISIVKGISKDGFINPNQTSSEDTSNYKVVLKGDFVFSPPRINIGSIGLWNEDYSCVCSPIYEVFYCSNEKMINEYLFLWLKRSEFYRYTGFHSIASVRNNFDFNMLSELEIPVPKLSVQKAIVEIYKTYHTRRQINENLKKQINEICPILIKGSVL